MSRSAVLALGWLAGLALCCRPAFGQTGPSITLHYFERPPFYATTGDGTVSGLVATPAAQAFARAGIRVAWELTPASRILSIIKDNSGADCSPGWYQTAEREAYARFTLPIYHDRPPVALARADFAVTDGITARDLLASPRTSLLIKQNFSHGAYLDALIAAMKPQNIQVVTTEVPAMIKMVHLNRANLIITTEEEVDTLVKQAGLGIGDFQLLKFPDVPDGERRHIMCSRRVPDDLIRKLNEVIGTRPRPG